MRGGWVNEPTRAGTGGAERWTRAWEQITEAGGWRIRRTRGSSEKVHRNTMRECLRRLPRWGYKERIKGEKKMLVGRSIRKSSAVASNLVSGYSGLGTRFTVSQIILPSWQIQSKRFHFPNVCYLTPRYMNKLSNGMNFSCLGIFVVHLVQI